jgi:hypothetical protein
MFKVLNQADGKQKIFAKGLSDGSDRTAGSGELYVSKDFIDAFKNLCTVLKVAFNDVRFVGSNKDYANDIANALQEVQDKLDITSIIANS